MSLKYQTIPTLNDGTYQWVQSTTLGDTVYRLTFTWNDWNQLWHLDIADSADNLLIAGLALTVGVPINLDQNLPPLPQGSFLVVDQQPGTQAQPGFRDLGSRHILIFAPFDQSLI